MCGAQKIDGVHHCSSCKRCVYKMDHHCPWTGNCVGYLTIKPFLLFLFYVTCLCTFITSITYRQAYLQRMHHISILQLIPINSGLKMALIKYFLNEKEKQEYDDYYDKEFKRQLAFDQLHPEIFSWESLKDLWDSSKFHNYHPFYNLSNFLDFLTIFSLICLAIYTYILLI